MSGAPVAPEPQPADEVAEEATDVGTTLVAPREATRGEKWRERVESAWRSTARVGRAVAEVIRPLGWVLIVATVVVWWLALAFGWEEFLVAAAVLSAVIVLCIAFLFGRTSYDIELDLTRTHVVVGERAVGGLTLVNNTSRTILPSEVVLPVGAGRGVFQVPRLAPAEEHEEVFAIPTSRRGVLSVGPVSVRRGDPLDRERYG